MKKTLFLGNQDFAINGTPFEFHAMLCIAVSPIILYRCPSTNARRQHDWSDAVHNKWKCTFEWNKSNDKERSWIENIVIYNLYPGLGKATNSFPMFLHHEDFNLWMNLSFLQQSCWVASLWMDIFLTANICKLREQCFKTAWDLTIDRKFLADFSANIWFWMTCKFECTLS